MTKQYMNYPYMFFCRKLDTMLFFYTKEELDAHIRKHYDPNHGREQSKNQKGEPQ